MNFLIILYIVNFLRTLIIIAVIYYAIRLISRYVLPLLIDKGVKNMQQKMYDQQKQTKQSSRNEGEVTIENKKQNNNIDNQKKGDYVDFEEVE